MSAAAEPPRAFTAEDYRARMDRVVTQAVEAGLDGVVVAPGPDLVWLTGYRPTAITERLTMLVLRPDAPPTLLAPMLERPDAEAAVGAPALEMRRLVRRLGPLRSGIGAACSPTGGSASPTPRGPPTSSGSSTALPGAGFRGLGACLPMLRAVKGPDELERLEAAGGPPTRRTWPSSRCPFEGRLETDVAADLARLLREHGHEQVDFTVVGSGPNGANPHHEAGDRRISVGDCVVLDFGGLMYGYGSDTSRTVTVGEPTPEVREVHDVVRAAQQAAFEAVRPGIACQEIDRVARAVITEAGYGEQFIHRTGHGIGVTTHEPPYMVEGEGQELTPGMCFSIEPGIYLSGRFGVRIEDIVTVTEAGGRRLNNTDRHLHVVA